MVPMEYESLSEIAGITLEGDPAERDQVLKLLRASLPVTSELVATASGSAALSPMSTAAVASINALTALVESAAPRCNLDAPPVDINVNVDGSGDMIYRCQHSPAHTWNLAGKRLS